MMALAENLDAVQSFTPSRDNTRDYRDALGRFGTGVTIITVDTPRGPVGMTANSFASVSLEPALVLWSLEKSSGRFPAFDQADHYAIHVAAKHQRHLTLDFAKNATAFDGCNWQANEHGVPVIDDMLATFECTKEAVHDAGDHVIIVGRVDHVTLGEGEPLMFATGRFGGFYDS